MTSHMSLFSFFQASTTSPTPKKAAYCPSASHLLHLGRDNISLLPAESRELFLFHVILGKENYHCRTLGFGVPSEGQPNLPTFGLYEILFHLSIRADNTLNAASTYVPQERLQ